MNGVIYGVQGPSSKFLPALVSIRSLRRYYNGPITVITDMVGGFANWLKGLDINVIYDRVSSPRFYGTLNDLTPYDNTLLVPAHTIFFQNINHIWDKLGEFDVLADRTVSDDDELEKIKAVNQTAYEMTVKLMDDPAYWQVPLFNLDILAFNKGSNKFFKTYEEEDLKMRYGSLIRAIIRSGVKTGDIPISIMRPDEDAFDQTCESIDSMITSIVVAYGKEMFKYFMRYQKDVFDECLAHGNVDEMPEELQELLFQ
jgi:hypothetical protein